MLPEVAALHRTGSLVRIPPDADVPLTDRVRRIVDTVPMRRLASISQLGMVSLVYPGATHSRFEHSLGVYHNALRLLARFFLPPQEDVDPALEEAFVVAALLHDVGHWPFCHPIEDMQLPGLDEHESRIRSWIEQSEIGDCVEQDWACSIDDVVRLLEPSRPSQSSNSSCEDDQWNEFFRNALSGPIDVDKLDYLQRDSLHCGVPYGRQFDVGRLISSMCVHPATHGLAIVEKGRTAAEMMVFSRYVMFSEVYWHHAVRSATAMLQRAVFLLQHRFDIESAFRLTDAPWIALLLRTAEGTVAEPLVQGVFGPRRQLYKRVIEFNVDGRPELHRRIASRPYEWLVRCSERLAKEISDQSGLSVHGVDVLVDAPPVKLEVDIGIDVVDRDGEVRSLGTVSPVASALARHQFDHQVKRVRVFVRPDLRDALRTRIGPDDWAKALHRVSDSLDGPHDASRDRS